MPETTKEWVQEGAGESAAAACTAYGAGALAPLCRDLGKRLGGFIVDGVASLQASVPTGAFDPTTQSRAWAALRDAYASLSVLLGTAVKQLALQTHEPEARIVQLLDELGLPTHAATRPRQPCPRLQWTGNPYGAPACVDDWWSDDDPRLSPTILPYRPSVATPGPLWFDDRTGGDNDGLIGIALPGIQLVIGRMGDYAARLLEVLPLIAAELALHPTQQLFQPAGYGTGTYTAPAFVPGVGAGFGLALAAPEPAVYGHRAVVPAKERSWGAAAGRIAGALAAAAGLGFLVRVLQ